VPISIEISNLSKSFGTLNAVSHLSLSTYPSQLIALLGPNGAGKSTLMNMITGYLNPSSGEIKILGKPLSNLSKKDIGFLPEGAPLYGDMSVKSFLKYITELKSQPLSEVVRVMELSNIPQVADQKIETLSKGYKRRVGFAAALIGDPPILLLDEPTDGLDPNQKEHILNLIKDMSKDKTILISTHLLDEAEAVANRILIMDKGTIKADGDLDAVLKKTKTTSLENAFIKLTR
jgi:ABC-2 type transport system ATP-binding protein